MDKDNNVTTKISIPKKPKKEDLCYKKTAIEILGISKTQFERLNIQHVKEVPNPFYKKGSTCFLYDRKKMIRKAKTKKVAEMRQIYLKRKTISDKAIITKEKKIITWAENITIEVPTISKEELIELACDHYNTRQLDIGKSERFLSQHSDPQTLARICENYIRHQMTRYDYELEKMRGKTGKDRAYYIIRDKVNQAISEKYDFIKLFNLR